MKTSIKSYLALIALIVMCILMIVKLSKDARSTQQQEDLCEVETLDLDQTLSYFTSMQVEAGSSTFELSNKQRL